MRVLFHIWFFVFGLSQVIAGEDGYDFVVSRDGTGDFTSIQAAFDATPDIRAQVTTILVKPGTYHEKLVLAGSKTNVHLIGEDAQSTIVSYDDFANKNNRFGEPMGTSGSASFYVFGDGFKASHLTFENTSGTVGQAVAVRVDGDQIVFEDCRFLGFQDTLYLHGKSSRQYYKNCYIEGTTDFIFGWSIAVFDHCQIHSKNKGQYITAASTPDGNDYGMVFIDCHLTAEEGVQAVYLGRPWRDFAKTVWVNCIMDKHVHPEGWHNWNKINAEATTYYAEWNSSGEGGESSERVHWSHQLSEDDLSTYELNKIFGDWNPAELKSVGP